MDPRPPAARMSAAMRKRGSHYWPLARTSSDGIDWVERNLLEKWRVVTGPVYDELAEYRNVNGSVALHLTQVSRYGENSLTMLCGDYGLIGVAALNKPELSMYGRLELALNGGGLRIDDYDIIEDSTNFAKVAFNIPSVYGSSLASAQTFGARILLPSEYGFFGFEMRVRDQKLKEMVTCH